jgi:hypothetical protein
MSSGTTIDDGTAQTLSSFDCPAGTRGVKTIVSVKSVNYYQVSEGEWSHFPITPKNMSFSVTHACAGAGGFVSSCRATVTLDYAHGVICGVYGVLTKHDSGPLFHKTRNFSCADTGNGEGEYPNIHEIIYNYRSYCCSAVDAKGKCI